jgi:hypothetical protein
MTRWQASAFLAAMLIGSWLGWRSEHRALDLVREHFDSHEPIGEIATEGW